MTTESYRFFVEHAYNQFFQHESFPSSAISKTRAKEVGASGELDTSTKLSGYVWLSPGTRAIKVPKDDAQDVEMDAVDDQVGLVVEEDVADLPALQVKIEGDDPK